MVIKRTLFLIIILSFLASGINASAKQDNENKSNDNTKSVSNIVNMQKEKIASTEKQKVAIAVSAVNPLIKQPKPTAVPIVLNKIQHDKTQAEIEEMAYGKSGKNRDLIYYRITNRKAAAAKEDAIVKIMITSTLHGYEDIANKDGEILKNITNNLINYFKNKPQELRNIELYAVPLANPDGLYDGWTNNGPGRCQVSLGIDLNRDFDYKFSKKNNARNKTSNKPFTAPESKALKELVEKIKPTVVLDFHGWENGTIGDGKLGEIFNRTLNLKHKSEFGKNTGGFFSAWAAFQDYCKGALLIEYPSAAYKDLNNYAKKTIDSIKEIIKKYG